MVGAGQLGVPGIQFVIYPLGPADPPRVGGRLGILVGLAPAWVAPVETPAAATPAGSATPTGGPAPQVEAAA